MCRDICRHQRLTYSVFINCSLFTEALFSLYFKACHFCQSSSHLAPPLQYSHLQGSCYIHQSLPQSLAWSLISTFHSSIVKFWKGLNSPLFPVLKCPASEQDSAQETSQTSSCLIPSNISRLTLVLPSYANFFICTRFLLQFGTSLYSHCNPTKILLQ